MFLHKPHLLFIRLGSYNFIGRIYLQDFSRAKNGGIGISVGYSFEPKGLSIAPKTLANFLECIAQLYEQGAERYFTLLLCVHSLHFDL